MDYEYMADFQRREEMGEDYVPAALTFTGEWMAENFPNGMDDDDIAAMNLAMDRDEQDRVAFVQERLDAARAEIAELREQLSEREF